MVKATKRIQLKSKSMVLNTCKKCGNTETVFYKTFNVSFLGIYTKTFWYACPKCKFIFPSKLVKADPRIERQYA